MILQQATFTSTRTSRSDGYHLVCRSRGIDQPTARALATWGPSHDSLRPGEAAAVSFFCLPNGDHCLARTTSEGWEHSGRSSRLHTHMLVIPRRELAKVEFHPIVIYELARACEQFRTTIPDGEHAPELELRWPDTRIELDLLKLATAADEMSLVPTVCEALGNGGKLGLVHAARPLHLLAGLFFWLPQEVRGEISFTTGLKYSPRRDFRLICLDDTPTELRQHARRGLHLLDLADRANQSPPPPDGWQAVMSLAAGG